MVARKSTALARVQTDPELDLWAGRINGALAKTVEGIFETGRQLLAARQKLEHGKWEQLFEEGRVPIGIYSARRFIEIYKRRDVLTNRDHDPALPPSWTTLYQLARLPDDTLTWAHEHQKIRRDLERKDIPRLIAEYENTPVPAPKPRLDPFGVRTPGSKLVSEIERRLNDQFEKLSDEDKTYVITMLRQTLETLESPQVIPTE